MSDKAGKAVEMKVGKGYAGAPEVKKFSIYEAIGIKSVLDRLKVSNPTISMKVDYWIRKNETEITPKIQEFAEKEMEVKCKYIETYSHKDIKDDRGIVTVFLVNKGKDDSDTLLSIGNMFYKLVDAEKGIIEFAMPLDKDGKSYVIPTWEIDVPSEGEEKKTAKMFYSPKFKEENGIELHNKEIEELEETNKLELNLYKLSEDNLDGLNVTWASANQDNVSKFRYLLYDNLIG